MNLIPNPGSLIDVNGNEVSSKQRQETLSQIQNLPIYDKLDDIRHAFSESSIMLLESGTGTGKSTQIPKIVYEYLQQQGIKNPKIISSAPRVAATIGLADRVWYERFCETGDSYWNLGKGVGYATGRGKNFSLDSSILYHTSGYEMMRLFQGGEFPDVLLLDEFHTDDIANMMLAYIVRDELLKNKHHCKVIITSATMNRFKTLDYFSDISKNIPVIEVPGKTFPVETITAFSHTYMDHVREQLLKGNNTLIFAAGKKEIEADIENIKKMLGEGFDVYAFHADISVEEQEKIRTLNPKNGTYIVIAATNSAQESLTISCLQTVIDKGWVKVASTNEYGINRLDLQSVTKSEKKQRKGRVGRVEGGIYIDFEDEPGDDREEFPTPPITQMTLEREVLLLLKHGHNMQEILTEHYAEGTKMFVDNPLPELVELSYERLYRMGAIDEHGITRLGDTLLTFPMSVFHSRMLYESIERDVSEDMIEIVAVLENKGFLLPQGKWKEAYSKEKSNSQKSDMFFQLSIFRTLCAYEHKEGTLNFLSDVCGLGFEWRKQFENGEYMLFECIPEESLEEFGVVKRSLQKMADTVDELYDRFKTQGIEVANEGSDDDVIMSILSGSLHNIFEYSYETKTFTNAFLDWGGITFEKTNTSVIKCDEQKTGGYYVGIPFIIGGRDGEEDMNLLTSLTQVNKSHIQYFQSMLEGRIPDYNFQEQTQQTRARNTYRAEIQKEVKFPKFDAEKIKQSLTKSFFSYIEETSSDYSYLFSSISDLQKNTEEYKSLIHSFENAKVLEQKLLKEQKKNSWVETFIYDLEQVVEGNGTSSLTKISLGASSKERLLLSDMVIKEFDFISQANNQKHLYTSIRNFVLALEKEKLSKEQKDMYLSGFANMYSVYRQNFGSAKGKAKDFVKRLRVDIRKNENTISTLQKEQETNNKLKHGKKIKSKIKFFERANKKIFKTIDDIQKFTETAEDMRNNIESIDFDEVIYRHVNETKGRTIFTKKYLYSVLGSIIFNGDFITPDLLTENKLLMRMSQNFGEALEGKESIESLLVAIKNVLSQGVSNESDSKSKKYILECIDKITTYYLENILHEDNLLKDLKGERNKHMHLQQYLYNLLCEFFDEEVIKRKEGRILQCIRHILAQSNTNNLDTILQELVLSFPFSQSVEYGDMFENIDTYTHNLDAIKKTYKGTIKRQIKKGELSVLEIEEQTLEYKKLVEKTSELKKIIETQLKNL